MMQRVSSFFIHLLVAVLSWSLVLTPLAMAQQEEMSTETALPHPPSPTAG